MTDKTTLLEGIPFERELANLVGQKAFKSAKFEGLFRSDKIVARPAQSMPPPPQLQPTHQFAQFQQRPAMPSVPTPSPVPQIISPPITPATTNNPGLARTTSNTSSSPSVSVAMPSVPNSWAYTAKQAPAFVPAGNGANGPGSTHSIAPNKPAPPAASQKISIPSTTTTVAPTPQIRRNRFGQRVDAPIPVPPKDEMNRIKKLKLCNQFMLRGECTSTPGTCYHDHTKRLSPGEMTTLRYIARMAPCKLGSECDDPVCTHGHVCPQSEEGRKDCYWKENCWFGENLHGLSTTPVKTYKV
jgi:hypothetical protein